VGGPGCQSHSLRMAGSFLGLAGWEGLGVRATRCAWRAPPLDLVIYLGYEYSVSEIRTLRRLPVVDRRQKFVMMRL